MPGVFRKLGVSIAVLCILLMLVFLTVREQGQFSAAFVPGTGLISQRAAVPEQVALLLAALLVAASLVYVFSSVFSDSGPSNTPAPLSLFSGPLREPLSALRC